MGDVSRSRIIAEALLASALFSATARAQEPPSLLLLTIDTLRADHVSSFDADSPLATPALDGLASDGVAFLRTWTTNPVTLPAHASLMTGLWPPEHGVRDFTGYRLRDEQVTLAETLSQAGYVTAAFVSAAVLDHQTGIAQGFQHYDDGFESFLGGDSRVAQRSGAETLKRARHWIERQRSQPSGGGPFFVWIHLYEPHDPYTPPSPFRERHPRNPYAGEVAYVDSLLSEFFVFLKSQELYRPSLICLLSDHGEGLGQHGESRHGYFLYESTTRIPWIIKYPNNSGAGRRVSEPASIVDVFPTLMHGLGPTLQRHRPSTLQGRSRYRLDQRRQRPSAIYVESLTPLNQFGWGDLRAWISDGHKYIDSVRPELFDLESDPDEREDLAASKAALAGRMQESLQTFRSRFAPAPSDDSSGVVDTALQERLRSLGYVGSPTAGRIRDDRAGLSDPKDKIAAYELMQEGVEAAREQRWKAALTNLRKAVGLAPQAPAITVSLALAYRDSGDSSQAAKWLEKALEINPSDTYTRRQLARLYLESGRSSEAGHQFERILEDDPRDVLALFNLGVQSARSGDMSQAVLRFEQALEIREDGETARMLGLALFNLGRLGDAERVYLRALELTRGDKRAIHGQLADLYQRLGLSEKASRHRALSH